MTSPTDPGNTSQNGSVANAWDPSSAAAASATLNGSANLQQSFNLWGAPNYFTGANAGFGSAASYNPSDLTSYWPGSNWNAAAVADSRFPMSKLNVPTASTLNFFSSTMGANAMRNARRRRNLFSQSQVNELKHAFEKEPYVKPETREKLAQATGLTPQQVKIWFQNNRYKCKQKQKEDDRVQTRPHQSGSFNDSGSAESPSSSGNELSMTATNSPEIKLHNTDISTMSIQTHDASADIKPAIFDPKQDIPGAYPHSYYPNYPHMPAMPFNMMYAMPKPDGTTPYTYFANGSYGV